MRLPAGDVSLNNVTFKECRNCRHWHNSSDNFTFCGRHIVEQNTIFFMPYLGCFCKIYASMNNLEYLESLYENTKQ